MAVWEQCCVVLCCNVECEVKCGVVWCGSKGRVEWCGLGVPHCEGHEWRCRPVEAEAGVGGSRREAVLPRKARERCRRL